METLTVLLQFEMPKEFFTFQSMLTLTGATGVVFLVSNGVQAAFNFNPKWLALIIAQILAIIGTITAKQTDVGDFLVAVINGFLIYSTSVGTNQITGSKHRRDGIITNSAMMRRDRPLSIKPKRQFNSRWF